MKSKLFIVLVIAACLCLSACTERSTDNSQSSENIPPSVINDSQKSETKEEQVEENKTDTDSSPQQEINQSSSKEHQTDYQEKYKEYLEHFFLLFSEEFADVSQLDPKQVTFFTLMEMVREYQQAEIPFEYDQDLDVYYVPKSSFDKKVEQYFGISDFDFVDTRRYSPQKDSYIYPLAHGFSNQYPEIAVETVERNKVILEVNYTNPEKEGNPIYKIIKFTFEEVKNDGKQYLQPRSGEITMLAPLDYEEVTQEEIDEYIENIPFEVHEIDVPIMDILGNEQERLKMKISLPDTWEVTEHAYWEGDTVKMLNSFFVVEEIPYEDRAKAVSVENKEGVLLNILLMGYKETPVDMRDLLYDYCYYIPYGERYVTIRFRAPSDHNTKEMALHNKILESIEFH